MTLRRKTRILTIGKPISILADCQIRIDDGITGVLIADPPVAILADMRGQALLALRALRPFWPLCPLRSSG